MDIGDMASKLAPCGADCDCAEQSNGTFLGDMFDAVRGAIATDRRAEMRDVIMIDIAAAYSHLAEGLSLLTAMVDDSLVRKA